MNRVDVQLLTHRKPLQLFLSSRQNCFIIPSPMGEKARFSPGKHMTMYKECPHTHNTHKITTHTHTCTHVHHTYLHTTHRNKYYTQNYKSKL